MIPSNRKPGENALSIQSWYWFRIRYAGGATENIATLDSGLQVAYDRQRNAAVSRARYPLARGWKAPPRVVGIDVLREPADLGHTDPVLKKYLDAARTLANTPD